MADTLGGSSKRTKICYDNDGIQACNEYFAVTNLETNKVEWHRDDKWRASALSGFSIGQTTVIGEYDPKTKKFTPNDKALASQAKYFTSPEGTKQIAQITKTTNTKSLVENGKTPEEAQQEAQQLSEGNYDNGSDTGDTTPAGDSEKSIQPDRGGTRDNFGTFQYPLNIQETSQDILKIHMMKWEKPTNAGEGKFGFERGGFNENRIIGSVILPIPGGIKDENKTTWGGNDLNALQMAAFNIANESITGGAEGAAGALDNINQDIRKGMEAGGLTQAVADKFSAAAIGKDFKTISGRFTGQIMNPNMELLFTSPTLRPFSFNFLLSPRSKKEAEQVIGIIRLFKQGMAPIRTESNLFLKAPHTFQLQYKHRGDDHPYLNKFKECALTSCAVNYAPEQQYATYEDGVMVAYSLTLGFQELEPVYNDDYEEDASTASADLPAVIGF